MRVKKIDNRGFTLVELLVSMVILGIVVMGACAFMVTATKSYSSMNYAVRLQYEAQLAMAQLQEYIVDCSAGIAWDPTNSTLYIVNNPLPGEAEEEEEEVGGAKKTVHVFTYMPDVAADPDADPDAEAPLEAKTISYGTGIAAEELAVTADELCTKHVDSMTVKLKAKTNPTEQDVSNAWAAEITLVMSRKNKTYTATQTVALRNQPIAASSWDDLWDTMNG